MALALLGAQAVEIQLNTQEGAKISGEHTFRVRVVADNEIVTQVEYYIRDEYRGKDQSTPYEFTIDTLAEPDGPFKIVFAAYTNSGKSVKKPFQFTIDNGMAKGLEFHLQAAREALQESAWDKALTSGRVALKIDAKSANAHLLVARAYYGKNVLDEAQKHAEDAIETNPDLDEARDLLTAVSLRQAFGVLASDSKRDGALEAIGAAYGLAIESTQARLDRALERRDRDQELLAYVDAALAAGRYRLAIGALQEPFRRDNRDSALVNRLAYAYLRTDQYRLASDTVGQLIRFGTPNAYSYAIRGLAEWELGNRSASDEALREALLQDSQDIGVRTAQAVISLKKGETHTLRQILNGLMNDYGQRPEVAYLVAALSNRMGEYGQGRKFFETAVLANPTLYDAYLEEGNVALGIAVDGRLDQQGLDYQLRSAEMLFQTALKAKPDSAEALSGLALTKLMQAEYGKGLEWARAAVKAAPGSAGAHYVLAAALAGNARQSRTIQANDRTSLDARREANMVEARKAAEQAGRLDVPKLGGREIPDIVTAWRYFAQFGRKPILTPPR